MLHRAASFIHAHAGRRTAAPDEIVRSGSAAGANPRAPKHIPALARLTARHPQGPVLRPDPMHAFIAALPI